eukprot:CAMPEP_0172754926 /NCGR_PEP_ID=MMETSP1074-20121228/158934_1 /TAXON_ID=2916 /ORGANISM="Ceratium fusus, Strain PA161109" /LENGTH=131 /DNA_ID=CAMNT_0013587947 /DNA_START=346 /DNA_END=741 /DNA_ORIENTATION=+
MRRFQQPPPLERPKKNAVLCVGQQLKPQIAVVMATPSAACHAISESCNTLRFLKIDTQREQADDAECQPLCNLLDIHGACSAGSQESLGKIRGPNLQDFPESDYVTITESTLEDSTDLAPLFVTDQDKAAA